MVYWLSIYMSGERDGSIVDGRYSVAINLNETGQRLLTAHMHMPWLCGNTHIVWLQVEQRDS